MLYVAVASKLISVGSMSPLLTHKPFYEYWFRVVSRLLTVSMLSFTMSSKRQISFESQQLIFNIRVEAQYI